MPKSPTQSLAEEFCSLLKEGKDAEAIDKFYADDVRHVEPFSFDGSSPVSQGKATIKEAVAKFMQSYEFHSGGVGEPRSNGDQFAVEMWMDCTFKEGPMAGQRHEMKETALYTVKDGKISEARFFMGS
ncbi:MAG: nuclear transport factor 2 family protein [Fimbriimonadaceae bacterium]|nr:nuclear transport factor 2 family protein [Fimbriimonadaceae bacterium]